MSPSVASLFRPHVTALDARVISEESAAQQPATLIAVCRDGSATTIGASRQFDHELAEQLAASGAIRRTATIRLPNVETGQRESARIWFRDVC